MRWKEAMGKTQQQLGLCKMTQTATDAIRGWFGCSKNAPNTNESFENDFELIQIHARSICNNRHNDDTAASSNSRELWIQRNSTKNSTCILPVMKLHQMQFLLSPRRIVSSFGSLKDISAKKRSIFEKKKVVLTVWNQLERLFFFRKSTVLWKKYLSESQSRKSIANYDAANVFGSFSFIFNKHTIRIYWVILLSDDALLIVRK